MNDTATNHSELQAQINQLRQQVEQLQQDRKIFNAILHHAPILISTKDTQGNVLMASRRFELIENLGSEQLVGRNVFDIFEQEVADSIWQSDLLALSGNSNVEVEEIIKLGVNPMTREIPLGHSINGRHTRIVGN